MFREVIETVKKYGFAYSTFPIILSLEIHCSPKQQDKMAEILEQILEDHLYRVPLDYKEFENYPSINELQYRVIVKGKGNIDSVIPRENKNPFKLNASFESCNKLLVPDDDFFMINSSIINSFPCKEKDFFVFIL